MSMTPEELDTFHKRCQGALAGIIDSFHRSARAMELISKHVRRLNDNIQIIGECLTGKEEGKTDDN